MVLSGIGLALFELNKKNGTKAVETVNGSLTSNTYCGCKNPDRTHVKEFQKEFQKALSDEQLAGKHLRDLRKSEDLMLLYKQQRNVTTQTINVVR